MKKVLLLGAILVLGTVANAANAVEGKQLVPVVGGTANGEVTINVTGKVVDTTGKVLEILIPNGANADGTALEVTVPDLPTTGGTESVNGSIVTTLLQGGNAIAMTGTVALTLESTDLTTSLDGVTLVYTLGATATHGTFGTEHIINVAGTSTNGTVAGTFNAGTAKVKVVLTGETA